MYTKHFGLRREPFSIAPDPRFLFMSERHREALAHLIYGLRGSGGVVLLTGEIGAGKTTVGRCFLEQIPPKCNVAYIFNPKLTVTELLQTVCEEFRIALPGPLDITLPETSQPRTVKEHVDALNGFLLAAHARGENNVLIIDEAQNLSADVLEQLRLLTNLETAERKLLQIILIGQPELRTLLAQPEMEQLAQRITARYHLEALNEAETAAYIRHRLVVSGRTGTNPFDSNARQRIFRITRGVPRRINLLCDRAMLGAYARGTQRITAPMIDEAAKEVFGDAMSQARWMSALHRLASHRAAWAAAGAVGGTLALALVFWAWPARDTRKPAAVPSAARAPVPAAATTPPAGATPSPAAAAPSPAAATPSTVTTPATSVSGAASAAGAPAVSPSGATGAATPKTASGATAALPDAISAPPPVKLVRDERQAWRLLALTAKITLGDGDPCEAAAKQKLACTKRSGATIEQVRGSIVPSLLVLRDPPGQPTYVVHTGVSDERTITVRGDGGERVKIDLQWLTPRWRGELGRLEPQAVAASTKP